jgi:quercetin dioxygenase-like cupin family protein
MPIYDWSQVKREQLTPLFERQMIHSSRLTIARLRLSKGTVVPTHAHENEQVSLIESGKIKFVLDGKEEILQGGQALVIPPNVPHSAEAIEDCVAIDIFSPPREDWIKGDDAYLRR